MCVCYLLCSVINTRRSFAFVQSYKISFDLLNLKNVYMWWYAVWTFELAQSFWYVFFHFKAWFLTSMWNIENLMNIHFLQEIMLSVWIYAYERRTAVFTIKLLNALTVLHIYSSLHQMHRQLSGRGGRLVNN